MCYCAYNKNYLGLFMSRNPYDPCIFHGGIYPSDAEAGNAIQTEPPPQYSYSDIQPPPSNTFFRSPAPQHNRNVVLFCGQWCPEISTEEFRKIIMWALNSDHDPITKIMPDNASKTSFFFIVSKQIENQILALHRRIHLHKVIPSTLERMGTFIPTFLETDPMTPSYRYPKHTLILEVAHQNKQSKQQQGYRQQRPGF